MNHRKKGAGEKRTLRVKWKSHLSFLLPEERGRKGSRGAIGPIHQVRGGRSAPCNMRLQWLWLACCVRANQYPFLRFPEAASKPKQLFLFNFHDSPRASYLPLIWACRHDLNVLSFSSRFARCTQIIVSFQMVWMGSFECVYFDYIPATFSELWLAFWQGSLKVMNKLCSSLDYRMFIQSFQILVMFLKCSQKNIIYTFMKLFSWIHGTLFIYS